MQHIFVFIFQSGLSWISILPVSICSPQNFALPSLIHLLEGSLYPSLPCLAIMFLITTCGVFNVQICLCTISSFLQGHLCHLPASQLVLIQRFVRLSHILLSDRVLLRWLWALTSVLEQRRVSRFFLFHATRQNSTTIFKFVFLHHS